MHWKNLTGGYFIFKTLIQKKKKESNLSLFCQGGKLVIMRKTASFFLWCFCNPYRLVQFSRWPHIHVYIDHKLLHYDIWHKSNIPRISSLSLAAFMSVMYSMISHEFYKQLVWRVFTEAEGRGCNNTGIYWQLYSENKKELIPSFMVSFEK